jgi:GST-like protein
MSTILYHGEPSGPSLTVLAALAESGVEVECRPINLLAGDRHTLPGITDAVALDMGVEGEGPVLVIDGEAMTESVFIAQYFDETGNGRLQPKDAYKHWEMLMWCRRVTERGAPAAAFLKCQAHAHPVLAGMDDGAFSKLTSAITSDDLRARWENVRNGNFPEDQIADSRSKVVGTADMANTALADGRAWLMGEFSIADLVTYSWLCADLVPEAIEGKAPLQAWMGRMASRPSVQAALARATVADPETCWAPGPEINRWG